MCTAPSEPEPELPIVFGRAKDYSVHPSTTHIIVEVAVTDEELDREKSRSLRKLARTRARMRGGDPHRAKDGHWINIRRITGGETLAATALPGIRLTLAEVFPALR